MTSRPDPRRGSLFTSLEAGHSDPELVTVLDEGPGWRLERIVSNGHASPPGFWYDQDDDELVFLVAGAARLELEDASTIELAPGDWLELPAHLRHRVAWTSEAEPTVWLAHFSRPD
ncbi:MAG: cupin domain-containing protein [Dehalococcoidia bacterium]